MKKEQIEKASNDFIELYADEIEAGEVSGDAIHEWFYLNVERYGDLDREDFKDVKKAVFSKI